MADQSAAPFHPSTVPAFITVVGVGDPEVTDRAAEALTRIGWIAPVEHYREIIAVHEGYGVESWCPSCREHWPCEASKRELAKAPTTNKEVTP